MKRVGWSVVAVLAIGCGGAMTRSVQQPAIVHDDAVWIVETNAMRGKGGNRGSNTSVIICRRDALPPCVRTTPLDIENNAAYAGWLRSAPARPTPTTPAQPPPAAPWVPTASTVPPPSQ